MKRVDLYVYLDNVQYRKNYFQNRNRISTGWLTVPVITRGHTSSQIKDIRIDNTQNWQKKYLGRLDDCFRKSENYHYYREGLWDCIVKDYIYMVDLNYALIELIKPWLLVDTPTMKASDLDVNGNGSELLLGICQETGADTYLSGPSGREYLSLEEFEKNDIEVRFHDCPHDNILSSVEYIINGD